MYKIKLDIKQNDFQRYVTHARFYDMKALNISVAIMKNEMKKFLEFMKGCNEKVYVRVLNSEEYNVYVVLDFKAMDVYFVTECNVEEKFISNICIGEDLHNTISQQEFDQAYFSDCVEKPTKVLIVMYYDDIVTFVAEEIKRFTHAAELSDNLIKGYKERMEEQKKEKAEAEVQAEEPSVQETIEESIDMPIDSEESK